MPLAKFAHASNGKQNLKGYNIDHSLSSDNFTCYVNHQKKEAVLAYVETRSTRHDIFVLHKLLRGELHQTHRHRHHMNIAVKFYNKYNHPGWKYALTGHGLGGRFAMDGSAHLRKSGKVLPAEAYNPLFTHHDRSRYTNNDFAHTLTHRDPNDFMSHNLSQVAGGLIINHEFSEDPNLDSCPSQRTGNEQPDTGTGTGSTETTTNPPPNTSTTTKPPPDTTTTTPPASGGTTTAKPPPPAQKSAPPSQQHHNMISNIFHSMNQERKHHPWKFWGSVVAGTLALGVTAALTGGATLEALAAAMPSMGAEAAGYTAVAGSEAVATAAEAAGEVASTAIEAETATAGEAVSAGLDDSFSTAAQEEIESSISSENSSEVSDFERNSLSSQESSVTNDTLLSQSEYDQEDEALLRNGNQNSQSVLQRFGGSIRNYATDAVARIERLAELQGRPFIGLVQRIGSQVGLSPELRQAIIAMIQTGTTLNVSYLIIKNEIVDPVENFIQEMIKFTNDPHGYIQSQSHRF